MDNKLKNKQNKMLVLFWINIILLSVLFLILLYLKGPNWTTTNENVMFEQYAIIFTLAGIPLALKLFHSQYKKIQNIESEKYSQKFQFIYNVRLVILDAVILLNFLGFYLFDSKNSIYMAIIAIFAIMFCYPSKNLFTAMNNEENK